MFKSFAFYRVSMLALGGTGLLVCQACAPALTKMSVDSPIEKRPGFLGKTYTQNGKKIDRADMISKLEKEPEAAKELSGYGALSFTALLFGAVGGASVGIPLGEAAGGSKEPTWILAGVGAGFIAVGIPLAIVADNKVDNAVDAHNRRSASPDSEPFTSPVSVSKPAAPAKHPKTAHSPKIDPQGERAADLDGTIPSRTRVTAPATPSGSAEAPAPVPSASEAVSPTEAPESESKQSN